MKNQTDDQLPVLGTILVKCDPGDERDLKNRIRDARVSCEPCLVHDGKHAPERACRQTRLVAASYCFGPFDFQLVIRAPDAALIERLVVECLRTSSWVKDTQTLIGIAIDPLAVAKA